MPSPGDRWPLRVLPALVAALVGSVSALGAAQDDAVVPLAQTGRPAPSIPLAPPDLAAGNANWQAGLHAAAQWIWTGNLMPSAFDSNLGRFLTLLPATFEVQLPYSTSLIFDEPSFRNGGRMSGFVDRVTRELVISYVAQRRRSWYSMTHHALIGALTARKHGLSDGQIADKWSRLLDYRQHAETYTPLEREALRFAEAFATDPKTYSEVDYQALRGALLEDARRRFATEEGWLHDVARARQARARALGTGSSPEAAQKAAAGTGRATAAPLQGREGERFVDAQVVELATLCLQFVALTDVFSSLNIPDEVGFADQLRAQVPPAVIAAVNGLNQQGGRGLAGLLPPDVDVPLEAILAGRVVVEPAPLRGVRVPLVSWEVDPTLATRDKGVAVGALHSGVFGWSNGLYFPGGLGLMLLNHPEMARTEPAYSLPLLFDEDEWRNGSQTAGFMDRRLKELVIMKVYRLTRPRYGVEHHTMFMLTEYMREYAGGQFRDPSFDDAQADEATRLATEAFARAILHVRDHKQHPGAFDDRDRAVLDWVEAIVRAPHEAWRSEPAVRAALDRSNRAEVAAGVRRLDRSGAPDEAAAYRRLLDRQIAELAMMAGHMDGLGRALTILRIEGEGAVQIAAGRVEGNRLIPTLDEGGGLQLTGYYSSRPDLLALLGGIGVPKSVLTANELLLNPALNAEVLERLASGDSEVKVTAQKALASGEF